MRVDFVSFFHNYVILVDEQIKKWIMDISTVKRVKFSFNSIAYH